MTEDTRDTPRRQNRQSTETREQPRRQTPKSEGAQARSGRQAPQSEGTPNRPKRQNRQYVVELEEPRDHKLMYTLGALGGVAIGTLLLRAFTGGGEEADEERTLGTATRERMPASPAGARPARLRRPPREQSALMALEDAVLEAFTGDDALRECGIDVGAISPGIVELSGTVWTRDQAQRAVAVAQGVDGVETVVNRLGVEQPRGRVQPRDLAEEGMEMSGSEWTGNQVGMGGRRQGRDTDPDRPDDSRLQKEEAMEQANRAQFADEGHHARPRVGERDEVQEPNRTHYREDELDNQSPYGQHAVPQGSRDDGPPQAFNSQSRVGEGLKPGTELELEAADVPVKPHQHRAPERAE